MANEIVVVERQLHALEPRFEAMLQGSLMSPKALIASVMIAFEKTPKLLDCSIQSIINSTNSAAALRLPMDGASGQFFMLPFKGVAQPCIGFKGYNTIGARSGVTITAAVVREGDYEWDYREGSGGFIRHKRKLDNKGRIIAAWALAAAHGRPDCPVILGIGEVEQVMQRSPAVRAKADTPWLDPIIGFPAMAEKTGRRRLARSLPYEIDSGRYQIAAKLDENFEERGITGYIDGRGTVVEGSITPSEEVPAPDAAQLTAPRTRGGDSVPEEILQQARKALTEAAEGGTYPLTQEWRRMAFVVQKALEDEKEGFKARAEAVDKASEPA